MIIILEGCDRTGKTTVAEWLIKRHGFAYKHFVAPKKNAFIECVEYLFDELEKQSPDENIVLDRYIHQELILGPFYRERVDIDYHKLEFVEHYLRQLKTCVIHTETPLELNWQLIQEENEGLITSLEDTKFLRDSLTQILSHSKLPVFNYDYTKDDINYIYRQIENLNKFWI